MSRFHYALASIVTFVWATVYLVDVFSDKFAAPPEVTGVMLAVVTALFGPSILNQWRANGSAR